MVWEKLPPEETVVQSMGTGMASSPGQNAAPWPTTRTLLHQELEHYLLALQALLQTCLKRLSTGSCRQKFALTSPHSVLKVFPGFLLIAVVAAKS